MSKVFGILADTRSSDGLCELCKTPMTVSECYKTEQFDVFIYRCPQCKHGSILLLQAINTDDC